MNNPVQSNSVTAAPIGVAVLGATGSIGENTLDVIARHPQRFAVVALAAHRNVAGLKAQCLQFKPRFAAMADADAARQLRSWLLPARPLKCWPARLRWTNWQPILRHIARHGRHVGARV
jgi:hypothetical protein